MKRRLIVLTVGLVVALTTALLVYKLGKGNDSPLDMVIVDATFDDDIKVVGAAMTDDEARMFSAKMWKMVLKGEQVEGLTYRQLLEMAKEDERAMEARIKADYNDFVERDAAVRDSLHKDSLQKGLIK
jgi:predicted nucleotidyltransferase